VIVWNDDFARVRDPADHRGAVVRSHSQSVGLERTPGGSSGGAARRWRRASCRLPTATTAVARCAYRRPAAASSGSSPRGAHLPRPPIWATLRWGSTGCSRARSPIRPHSSTCSRATRSATRPGLHPRPSRSPSLRPGTPADLESPPRRCRRLRNYVDPICAQAVSDAAELLRSLGHDVQEVDPPGRWRGSESCSEWPSRFTSRCRSLTPARWVDTSREPRT